ncbi:MAG: hypothetical protein ACRDUY_06815, partial [Nitriliruptorales bacterium]
MTVLHALWTSDDRLHVWGERPLAGGRLPLPKGREPATGRPRRHPYAASDAGLREALGELTGLGGVAGLAGAETTVVLPTATRSPLPSPDLPGGSEVAEPVAGLRGWRADALEVAGADVLALLLAIPSDPPAYPAGRE